MLRLQRTRYRMPGLMIVGMCLLLLSSFPSAVTQAATKQQEINNALADFKDGQFQRASLTNSLRSGPNDKVTDKLGGVQLGPVGLLKGWKPGLFTLPKKLYSMGAAAIGSRIFLVGGLTPSGVGTGTQRVADVWSVGVSPLDGALLDPGWQAEPALPAVQGSDQTNPNLTAPVAPIASPSVVATSDAAGLNGFIYVIGGNAAIGTVDYSSYAVRIGTVANGRVTGWQEQIGARLPSLEPTNPFIKSLGAQQAMAVTAQIGGVTYVYLMGGIQRSISGGSTVSTGLKTVFYARVGAGGKLFKPSSPSTEGWDRMAPGGVTQAGDIPVQSAEDVAGLWDASAVADNYVASTQAVANAIYLIGGQVTPTPQESGQQVAASYSSVVYRALIQPNGELNWGGVPNGVLLSPRSQSSAVAFRGNIYMTGGVPNGTTSLDSDSSVLTTYVEDDLSLHRFLNLPPPIQGDTTNFLQSSGVLPNPRKLHSSVLVRADASSPNSAFLFVLGGIGAPDSDLTDDNGSDTVLYGKIGGGEDVSTTGYASDGWYYAQPFDVAQQFSQVQVQEIDWTTVLTRTTANMDIALDYRLSSSNNCASATWSEWTPLDGSPDTNTSVDGQNSATIVDPSSRCFQYRAHLTTSDAFATPILLNVSVKVNIPGSPDLSPKTVASQQGVNGAFLGLNVVIQNVNTIDPPTLAADIDQKGSFFVDLCIFGPNPAPGSVVAPTLPLTTQNPQCSKAYANVNRSLMGANVNFSIVQWRDTATNQVVNLVDYFKQPGSYTVIAAVDSFNNVNEGDKGQENNNVSQPVSFNVAKIGRQVSLPFASK